MIAASAMRCYIRAFDFRFDHYTCISMGNFIFSSEGAPGGDETEETFSSPGDTTRDALENSLRHLRLRRLQQEFSLYPTEDAPIPNESAIIVGSATEDAGSEDLSGVGSDDEAETGVDFDFRVAFDELSQEIRRMGREMFKTNRVAERNQEIFTETLTEIRDLASVVAKIPQQNEATLNDAKFEAKVSICRELLRMADTMETSLSAADELIAQLQARAGAPAQGVAYWFAATQQMRASLAEAVSSLRQWREGQSLQAERLRAILQAAGVREIETAGRAFDPARHRAVSIAHRGDVASGVIVGEELKGYTLDGHILRYAEVIVAKNEQDSRN
ncbi:MAG: nucleotide exchange factor GrpE [Blastocatellia bacterium]